MMNKGFSCSRNWCCHDLRTKSFYPDIPVLENMSQYWRYLGKATIFMSGLNIDNIHERQQYSWVDFPYPCSSCFPQFSECSAWIPQSNWAEGDAPYERGGGGGGGGGEVEKKEREEKEEEAGIPDWVIWVSECAHMGRRANSETSCRRHRGTGGDL